MPNQSFNHFLRSKGVSNEIRSLLYHIARSVKYINFSLRAGNTGIAGTQNYSGEDQLALDVVADKIVMAELEQSELVALLASEEQNELISFPSPRGQFTVAYDPLDGSSLVDANLAIGSIFGVWKGNTLKGRTGNELEAAVYAIYGPQVILMIAVKGKGVHEFELNDVGEFLLRRESIQIQESSKYFAPGNLRACTHNPRYKALIDQWIAEERTLRYSGGMVPDLHHILSKNQGIFSYPGCSKHPNGKLRLSFECAPFAFIFKEAGGLALDQNGTPILDIEIKDPHERTTLFIGSKSEVKKAVDFLQGSFVL
jgi:fructose-1,6-bisphosphatase I